jgi:hypothetical protein
LLLCGGLGLAGLTLPDLLRHEARASAPRVRTRSVILIQHYGAPSHIDLWDPKPDAPAEIRGEFRTIPTTLPGYRITEIMPHIARVCDRLTVVRSMTHRVANHNPATYQAITGHAPERDVVQVAASPSDWPAFGSALARLRPQTNAEVPPFVQLPHVAYDQVYKCPGQWGGLLGKRYDPLIVLGDPNDPDYRVAELSLSAGLTAQRLEDRRTLLRALDGAARRVGARVEAGGIDAYYERAFGILTSARTRRAFDLAAEPERLRARYGRNQTGQCYLLARRLIEAGVRFVTVFNGSNPGNGWDTHTNNFPMLRDVLMPSDDCGFSALIEDLEARGLLESTLVIWAGEFGRKPHIGQVGATFVSAGGRDHWPSCYSLVLAGGGVRRGHVYSASDRFGAYPQDRPVTPADFAATLYWSLGIDPRTEIHDLLGRPLPLTTGNAVTEWFV